MIRKTAIILSMVLAVAVGCSKSNTQAPAEPKGEHVAAHGGCLNALTTCENGHAEIKLDGPTLSLWFVGGGPDTIKSVCIPDNEFTLSVTMQGEMQARNLVLVAKPNELAQEKAGNCSHFEARADWLKDAKAFVATGEVTFKGKKQPVRIEYPAGYDPD